MSKTKIIWGAVNANGTIQAGAGFRVSRLGNHPGFTDIIFETPFAGMPVVVATQNYPKWDNWNFYSGNARDNAVLVAANQNQFRILTGDSSGSPRQRNFTFTAIGPIFT